MSQSKEKSKKQIRRFRLQNGIDDAISRGFASLIIVLSICSLVIVLAAGAAYFFLSSRSGMSPAESLWTAFAYLTNPELPSFADAADVWPFAIITLIVVIIGLLVTSALVGIITTALTSYYEGLQRGVSPVLESNHFTILGFNDNAHTLINELLQAHRDSGQMSIVFVDDALSREEMEIKIEGFINKSIQKLRAEDGCSIICRHGNLRDVDDLKRYAVDKARAVIINDYDDSIILKTLLAVASLFRHDESLDESNMPTIVCTFRESQFARAASHVGYESKLRILSLSETLSNLIAKTCYQPGLSRVLEEICSFEGVEFYFVKNNKTVGMHFDELGRCFEKAIPIGICRESKALACGAEVIINAPEDCGLREYNELMTIREGDEIVVLAQDKSDAEYFENPENEADDGPDARYLDHCAPKRKTDDVVEESILVIGYDETFDKTIVNLAKHYRDVSCDGNTNCLIKLLYRNKREHRVNSAKQRFLNQFGRYGLEIEEAGSAHGYDSEHHPIQDIKAGTTLISFQCACSNVIDLPILEDIFLCGTSFDHVIVLSDLSMDREGADTETLLTLLYLRAIAENARNGKYEGKRIRPFRITSEIQNMENVDLAYNEYVSDYIISWKLIASLQVQIAENRHLYKVLRDLLKTNGSEIVLEPVIEYVDIDWIDGGNAVNLDSLASRFRQADNPCDKKTLIGYVRPTDGTHVLCPPRNLGGSRVASLRSEDMLVVIKNAR